MSRLDPHSFSDSSQPDVVALDWRARVDFASRTLEADAVLTLRQPAEGPLDLDTRDLRVLAVTLPDRQPIPFFLGETDAIRGTRLRLDLPPGTSAVHITYRTSATASALHWLAPVQTAGGREPYLYSQCQALHARSLVPLQDTPRLRIRYRAALTIPSHLRALMAAEFAGRDEQGDLAVERYVMDEPIPPYLLALAVGDLVSRELGPRSRVWAEPSVVDRAAARLPVIEEMVCAAERLFGPYPWGRFDLLVMPPAFPYGGMENPCLAFLSATLLDGDASAASPRVLLHELAHSWTGNLVTASSAEHFWLNEGPTVYAERRLLEALEGTEAATLHAILGRRELDRAFDALRHRPDLTRLRTHLDGIHTDDALSLVPYEKGYLFVRSIEEAVGRARFDAFLREHLEAHRFRSITSEEFAASVAARLPEALAHVDLHRWLDEPGLPGDASPASSARLDALTRLAASLPGETDGRTFSPVEWRLYLDALSSPLALADCEALDARFQLTRAADHEVLVAWLPIAALSGHAPAVQRVEEIVGSIGRLQYLKPLYESLARTPATRDLAGLLFRRHRERYHPIARAVIESVLRQHRVTTHEVNPVSLHRRRP